MRTIPRLKPEDQGTRIMASEGLLMARTRTRPIKVYLIDLGRLLIHFII